MKKKGEMLIENVIFLILNLVFLSIMIIFLMKQGTGVAVLEESYSKQIALVIDSAKSGMIIEMDMRDGFEAAQEKGVAPKDIVSIEGSFVNVKLSPKGGYSYHYFNNVSVVPYPGEDESEGMYVFTIN